MDPAAIDMAHGWIDDVVDVRVVWYQVWINGIAAMASISTASSQADTFPTIESFHSLIEACGALPCAAWLDGTLPGEQGSQGSRSLRLRRSLTLQSRARKELSFEDSTPGS